MEHRKQAQGGSLLMETKTIARAGVVAALYAVLTVALAPISYGPIQFRISEMLKPLALYAPWLPIAFAVGTMLSNLTSPFGLWDILAMPVVDAVAGWLCWKLRPWPWLALIVQASVIAVGVAVFPLGFGGGLPPRTTVVPVAVSQVIILCVSYAVIWRPFRDQLSQVLGQSSVEEEQRM